MILINLLVLFLSISNSIAGDTKGHGGDIIRCQDINQIEHNQNLDYYELITKYKWQPIYTGKDEIEIAHNIIQRIIPLDSHRGNHLLKNLSSFYQDVKWVNFPLANVRDSGEVNLPQGCKLEQIINQNKRLLRGSKKYLVRKERWNELSTIDKSFLIVHELLYLDSQASTSVGIRKLNAMMFADEIKFNSKQHYWDFLLKNKFPSFTYKNMLLKLNSNIQFHGPGLIKSAEPVPKSSYLLNSVSYKLTHDKVFFYDNGQIKSFCSHDLTAFELLNTKLYGKCINLFSYYKPIEFFPNGKLKTLMVNNQNIETPTFKIQLGDFDYTSGQVLFSADSKSYTIKSFKLTLKTYAPQIEFKKLSKLIIKGELFKAHLKNKISLPTPHASLWIHKDTTINKGRIIKSFTAQEKRIHIGLNTILIANNTPITFYSNGTIKTVIIGENHNVTLSNGITKFIEKGEKLNFTKTGDIL